MVAKNESGENAEVPGLILDSKQEIRRFIKGARLLESKRNRKNEFKDADFQTDLYRKELEDHNVIVAF
jgi:hypothetical protein